MIDSFSVNDWRVSTRALREETEQGVIWAVASVLPRVRSKNLYAAQFRNPNAERRCFLKLQGYNSNLLYIKILKNIYTTKTHLGSARVSVFGIAIWLHHRTGIGKMTGLSSCSQPQVWCGVVSRLPCSLIVALNEVPVNCSNGNLRTDGSWY